MKTDRTTKYPRNMDRVDKAFNIIGIASTIFCTLVLTGIALALLYLAFGK